MSNVIRAFAIFTVIILLGAALQPAIASTVKTSQNSNSTTEPSYVTEATASALASLVQMRDTANQHRRGIGVDVEALINATPGPEINFSIKWGSAGDAPGQFIEPPDAAFDSKGNIYVLDTVNNRIQKFYPNGTFIAQWGTAGNAPGQFHLPHSIALCPTADNDTDLVFVADTGNNRIQKFYSNGTFVAQWGSAGAGEGQFKNPTGIATDIAGNVFVADTENHRIQKFNSSGTFITKWGGHGTGNGTFNRPSGIAIDSFSIDSTGAVFVADTANYRIQKFNSSGGFITKWGSEGAAEGQFQLPHGVAIDSSGNVYVADTENYRIQKFDYNGSYILKWGCYGTGNGTFKAPAGIAVGADGFAYVADTDNNRVQKFSQRDNDADSIPNSVELVLGTDPNYYDTDRDLLNDSYEVRNKSISTDPRKLDSNGDGLADYYEVTNISLDVDGDGIPNAWDCDNDGDGVVDGIDKSPFTKSTTHDKFHFDIKTKGNATYIDFQVRPKNPEHMKLPFQSWDWPFDDKGQIQDLDYSKDDVHIQPMLELSANQVPNQSAVKDYGIVVTEGYYKIVNKHNGKCVNVDIDHGDNICQWEYQGLDWQKWKLEPVGDGWYKIINKHSGKCVNVDIATGNNICQWEYQGLDWQKWKLEPVGDGWYKIINKYNGKCVNVDIATGNNICQWEYAGLDWQKWKLELVEYPKAYVPLTPAQDYGTTVAFNGRMFYPSSDKTLNLSADARLVWMVNDKVDPLYSSPAAVSWGKNRIDVFVRGTDSALWHKWWDGQWHDWESMGGNLTSAPAVASWGPKRLDVFARGEDNALWHKSYSESGWSGWESLGGVLTSAPAAVSWGPNRIDVFVRDTGNGLNHKWWDGQWHDWDRLGGVLTSAPAVASWGPNRLDVFVRARDNSLCHKYFSESGWSDWDGLGGYLTSAPAAVSWGPNRLDVFVRNTGNGLSHKCFDGQWHVWDSLGGKLTSAPAAASWGPNRLDVFARGTENTLYHKCFDGQWHVWHRLGVPPADLESEATIIARYKEDFMLTGFSVTENYGSDAGLFYSTDKNQTVRAYLALRYEFLNSNNTLSEAEKTLSGHNIIVTSDIKHFSHTDAMIVEHGNMTIHALQKLGKGKELPIAFAVSDTTAIEGMEEFVSDSYVLGDRYSINMTADPPVTNKAIKLPWYNTTTQEFLEVEGIVEEVDSWNWSDDEKANIIVLLLLWREGERRITKVGKFDMPCKEVGREEALKEIDKLKGIFDFLRDIRIAESSVFLIAMLAPILEALTGLIVPQFIRTIKDLFFLPEEMAEDMNRWMVFRFWLKEDLGIVNDFNPLYRAVTELKTAGEFEGDTERFVGKLTKLFRISSADFIRAVEMIGKIMIVIAILAIIAEFLYIAYKEGWTGFGFAVGGAYAILGLIYLGILLAISCIPVVGWIIALVIIIADIIATFVFHHGSSWLMKKIVSLLIDFKLRSKIDLKLGETSVNIKDNDDNGGLTVGDKLGIKSWFWAKTWETKRGKHHGDHHDYRMSYIHPKYEYKKHDSTFGSGSYDHYCDSSEDHDYTKKEKCYTGLWIKPKKGMINLPLTTWLSADYKFYYDECCCLICSGKSETNTTKTKHDTSYFDVLPGNIHDFVRWHAISLRDNDGDGLLNEEEKGFEGGNYYKICAEHSGKCLDVKDDSTANGANVQQWEYEGKDNQKWKLEPVGDGYHKICAKHSGKCLDVSGGGTADGANVQQWEYGGGDNQKWNLEHVGDGNYKIINNRSSKCMNVSDNSTANGANVWQWDWLNKGDQKWKLIPVECDTNANKWDTDADGLSDRFEVYSAVDYGTNPRIADTDADGLTDMLEFELGSLPDEKDTDDDGLTDFEEHRGWRINFTYRGSGPVFNESVWSNALFNDSDMDGLNDSEEYRIGFNPRSRDTNGDGISDYDEVHGKSAGASAKEGSRTITRGTDEDGLTDGIETAGWNISFTNSTGMYTIHVTSEPLLADTDFDGLNDSEEYNLGSNPRARDTDGDGLNDFVERELGTDITHYDTDGDGLDDGTEVTFGSDPKQNDTDADGLPDFEEFELGSDPINNDTDSDGLTDSQEKQFNTSLLLPDSDADLLFDNEEYNLSTDPWNPDTDNDNLTDGYEIVYNTNATNNDTDADSIPDGDEIDLWTNPLSNDTDSDGLLDLRELELGTNPVNADTNGDGINDSEDPDTHVPQVEQVVLAYDQDADKDTYEFVDKLKQYTNVTVVTAEELLLNYSDAQCIVLVGRPDGNGTVGNITRDILNDSGDVTTQTEMRESDYDRVAVEYGVWTPRQTVVMLSQPYKYDYCRVLSILKCMRVTRLQDSVEVEYPSARDFFSVEMVKEVDSSVWMDLEHAVTPGVKMSRYNASTTPFVLTHAAGLAEDEEAVGKYFEIEVSENVQNETGDIINWAWVGMYYTASDLDRNGDGDANDTGDIHESTLRLYYFDESANRWTKLSADLDWVFDVGVNTTDDELYGKEYEGFVWANVSHLCLFGLGGKTAAPIITSFDPPSPVKDIVGNWRSFNVTVNQTVNVSWYLNDSLLFTYEKVTEANYWLLAEVVGEHNVSAIATNANGTDIQTWVWNVETPSPCYIATATYGTPLDENINVLRDFRDKVLMTNPIGEAFVYTYYATSPPIADALRENDGLRAASRVTLITPLVYFSRFMLNGFWFVLLMLLGLAAAAVLLLREDKKKFLKSLSVGAGAVLVFIAAIFSLGFVGYTVPFCAVIGAYLLPFVIPLSVVFTLCTYYKNSWVHKQSTRFHKIYTRLKIRE